MTDVERDNQRFPTSIRRQTMSTIALERNTSSHRGRSDLQRGPAYLLVKLRVAAAASDRTPLAEVLWSLLERHCTCRLALDLEGAGCLDEAVVTQLMTLAQRIIAHRGTIRLFGLSAYNRRVLEQFETFSELPVCADIWEALFAERRPRIPRCDDRMVSPAMSMKIGA